MLVMGNSIPFHFRRRFCCFSLFPFPCVHFFVIRWMNDRIEEIYDIRNADDRLKVCFETVIPGSKVSAISCGEISILIYGSKGELLFIT